VIASETDETLEHPTYAVIEPVPTFDNDTITDWARRRLAPGAEAFSATGRGASVASPPTIMRTPCSKVGVVAPPPRSRGARWVNMLLSHLKRSIGGAYHAFKPHKYARRHLAAAAYRFNRRFRLREFVPRLLRAMLRCAPCPEPFLRQATNFPRRGSAPIRSSLGHPDCWRLWKADHPRVDS
jgi:hypothetical protein